MCIRDRPQQDGFAFILCHKGQHLQHNVGDEYPDKGALIHTGVQQRHIQYHHVCTDNFGDETPFLDDLVIVAAKAVDRFDHQKIAAFESAVHESLVARSFKIFTGHLVKKNVPRDNPESQQCIHLSIFVFLRKKEIFLAFLLVIG